MPAGISAVFDHKTRMKTIALNKLFKRNNKIYVNLLSTQDHIKLSRLREKYLLSTHSPGIFYHPNTNVYYPPPTPHLPSSTGGKTHDNMNLI